MKVVQYPLTITVGCGKQMSFTYLAEMREAKLQTTPLQVGKPALCGAPEHLVHRPGVNERFRTFLAQPLLSNPTRKQQGNKQHSAINRWSRQIWNIFID